MPSDPIPDNRQNALASGVLLDISEDASQYGFLIPVAISAHFVESCIMPPPGVCGEEQTAKARLGQVLIHALNAAQSVFGQGVDRVIFECPLVMDYGWVELLELLLYMETAPHGESVATIVQFVDGNGLVGFTATR